ncbi:MAG: amidase family protein, partial [Chloroflexi bacterium]|nr:amidase family protein [Chloroflexota bacterium]
NWTVDHIGPLTHTVADAKLLLEIMQGYDPGDPESSNRIAEPFGALNDLSGIRIGVPETHFWEGIDSEVEAICRKTLQLMADAGATLAPLMLETIKLLAVSRPAAMADSLVFHEPYLRANPELYGEELRHRLMSSQYILATDYVRAQRVRRLWTEECSRVLETVDVLATPTRVAPPHLIGDPAGMQVASTTQAFNQSGHPAITIPAGLSSGDLPVGFQLAAAAFQDYKLMAIAAVVESLIGFNTTPPVLRMTAAVV